MGPNAGILRDDPLKFTPQDLRVLGVLSDGLPHSREEILANMIDPLSDVSVVKNQISLIRKKMSSRGTGHTIVCEMGYKRVLKYRHVRLISYSE